MSPLLSTPLRFFLSLSGPPPTLPLTLLPEFCSNSQSDHLPPAPAREEEGKFHSVTLSDGGGSPPRSPLRFPLSPVKWSDANQLHTQQHKHSYVIVLIPARRLLNPPGWQACQSRSNLPASLALTLPLSEFPSDLSGHISAASLSWASRLRAGLSHAGRLLLLGLGQVEHFLSTGVADRWSWPVLYFTLQWKDEEFDNILLLWFHMIKFVSLNGAIVSVKCISHASLGLFHSFN